MCISNMSNSKDIISKVAFLLGVPQSIFDNQYEPPMKEIYNVLTTHQVAVQIRHLCSLRTYVEKNYSVINLQFETNLKNLHTLGDPQIEELLNQLADTGIKLIKCNHRLNQYIIDINQLIINNISGCRELFPESINWEYIKSIFIMPDGLSEKGIKREAQKYYTNINSYPYQVYMGVLIPNNGNILFNDEKFIKLLYQANNDEFRRSDILSQTDDKSQILLEDFILNHKKTVIAIDTENSDPYKVSAVITYLKEKKLLSSIARVIMISDTHSSKAWHHLKNMHSIEIEDHQTERIKSEKSLVDIELSTRLCKEFWKNQITSFILLSSDSDYYGVIKNLPEADFFVMVEASKCSSLTIDIFKEKGILYGTLDTFYDESFLQYVLTESVKNYLLKTVEKINIKNLFSSICFETYSNMSKNEMETFFDRYIKNIKITFSTSGSPSVIL